MSQKTSIPRLDALRTPNGFEYEEVQYSDAVEALHCGVLGFCGCNMPRRNLEYIREMLRWVDRQPGATPRSSEVGDFFAYWAAARGLITHGSCLPGWLSPSGEGLLADIETALKETPE